MGIVSPAFESPLKSDFRVLVSRKEEGVNRFKCAGLVLVLCTALAGSVTAEESESAVENPVVFWELASHDADASVEFFRKVFDWNIEFSEKLGFYQVPVQGGAEYYSGGYVFTLKKAKLPFLTIFILVDDIEAKVKIIEECGGHIVEPPTEFGSGYKVCLFNEPSGVTFAMFQPAGKSD